MQKIRFSLTCRDGGSVFARALIYLFLALFMVTVIYPIYYLLMKSFPPMEVLRQTRIRLC